MLNSIGDRIGNIYNSITQGLSNVISTITSSINNVVSAIGNIVTNLINALTNLLKSLFIPSQDFFKNKIDGLINKFAFVDSIVDSINVITDYLENTDFNNPPNLSIDLDLSKSKYNYGDSAIAIDFSWYKPYKPSVDIVLSAILYLNFAWVVFKDLPNIIQGVGSGASAYDSLQNELTNNDRV